MCFSSNINCSIVSIHASVYSFPCVGLKHRNILVKHNMDTNWNYNYHNLFVIPSSCKACWKMQICVCASGTHTRKCAACCLYVWEVIPCKRMLVRQNQNTNVVLYETEYLCSRNTVCRDDLCGFRKQTTHSLQWVLKR